MLVPYNQDGFELLINESTGEAFASINAVARMCKCERVQIRRLVGDTETLKTIQVKTSEGDREAKLLPENLIKRALIKYNPELAEKCMDVGIRVVLHELAGYQVKSELPGQAEEKLEGYAKFRDDLLATAKQKCYNPKQGEQAFSQAQGYWKDMFGIDSYNFVTREQALETALANTAATIRLMKEEDKSLVQTKAYNTMVKAGRHGVYATKGVTAVPISCIPKCKQKLIEQGISPLTGNPSSRLALSA